MGGVDLKTNIGGYIAVNNGVKVTDTVAATINGTGVDRMSQGNQYESCTFAVVCGDATGTPTTQTVDCKLQHSTALGSGYADVTSATTTQITANNTLQEKDWNLSGLNRYIRLVVTVNFTGGSTPTIPVAAMIVLGGKKHLPA